jgi:hypothetical protein
MLTTNDLIEAAHQANEAASNAAESSFQVEKIKEESKDILAVIMTELKKQCEFKISEAELERLARSHEKWTEFRERQYAILEEAMKKKVIAQNTKLKFDAYQSVLSYMKEEMKRIGGT